VAFTPSGRRPGLTTPGDPDVDQKDIAPLSVGPVHQRVDHEFAHDHLFERWYFGTEHSVGKFIALAKNPATSSQMASISSSGDRV